MGTAELQPVVAASTQTPAEGTPHDLAWLLERHPWEARWLQLGRPVELWRHFDLDVDRVTLWPHLQDTSTFNRRLGFGQMTLEERGGRLHGQAVNGGKLQVWEEVPWEWTHAQTLSNARIYSRGWAHYVRSRYLLEDLPGNRTRLYVYFGWIPRGATGRIMLGLGASYIAKHYARVLSEITAEISQRPGRAQTPPSMPFVTPLEPSADTRLSAVTAEMAALGVSQPLLEKLVDLVCHHADNDVYRMRPKAIAAQWGMDLQPVLGALLAATRAGLTTFTWDVVCPHCRGLRQEVTHLGELPRHGNCEACGVSFDATNMNTLEVTFHVHPAIRRVERHWYCTAEPARRPHIVISRTLAPGAHVSFQTLLGPDRYRLRTLGQPLFDLVDVTPEGSTSTLTWTGQPSNHAMAVRPFPTVTLHNASDQTTTFVMERTAEDALALRPADIFLLPQFRDLFSQEAVAADIQLDIGARTVMFTDMVGSTRFYEEAGDSVAFAQVRRHFVTAYQVVEQHGGVVVKTIGDAVMASFHAPDRAMAAAVALQRCFDGNNPDTPVRLRVTLHTGPCLAVRLNTNIDLFGSTVNLAAKLQSEADAGQIVFTSQVGSDPGVADLLRQQELVAQEIDFSMKWSGRVMQVLRVNVS